MSRLTKLTPEVQNTFLEAIDIGLTHKLACEYAVISESTFYAWVQRGKAATSGIYLEFLDALARAEAQGASRLLAQIRLHAATDWRAAAWVLERRHPDDYGKRAEVTGKEGGPVQVETKTEHVFQPTPEVWDQILSERAEFQRLRDGDETASDSL